MNRTDLPLVLYGAGNNAVNVIEVVKKTGMMPICFCDSDVTKHGSAYLGLPVMSLEQALGKYKDFYICATPDIIDVKYEIVKYLLEHGINIERILINFDIDRYSDCHLVEFSSVIHSKITDVSEDKKNATTKIEAYTHIVSYNRIQGWAWCPNDPSIKVQVALIDSNGCRFAVTIADRQACFSGNSVGDGCYCFVFYGYLGNVSQILFSTPEIECTAYISYSQPPDPVFALIHPDDMMFHYTVDAFIRCMKPFGDGVDFYFSSGKSYAKTLEKLCLEHLVKKEPPINLLEFASGYGRMTRHIDKSIFNVTATDIYPEAISFIKDQFCLDTLLSTVNAHSFFTPSRYDVVFALSFFTHMPDSTFGDWLAALYKCLRNNGLLIFSTHGKKSNLSAKIPVVDGFGFLPQSEQKALNTAEYGITVSELPYVVRALMDKIGEYPILFSEAFWGHQDLYIVRNTKADNDEY